METARNKHFCVVGAGAVGIVAVKSCLEIGAEVTCFERAADVGGLWRYTAEVVAEKASVAKTTVANTSKEFMAYSDFPVPADYPNYMRHEKIFAYFTQYVEHFGLNKHINFNMAVIKVDYSPDYETTGKWSVTHRDLQTGTEQTTIFDGVLLCTGLFSQPNIPQLRGLETFKGQVLHTHDYRTSDGFVDKNILVVGVGNSGADVASELGRVAKSLHLSTRRGAWCVPRSTPQGLPTDIAITRAKMKIISSLPLWLQDRVLRSQIIRFDHQLLGIQPKLGPAYQGALINDDLPSRILSGLIKIRTDIKEFGPTWVTFVDGSRLDDLDAVVLATGYRLDGLPFLSPSILNLKDEKVQLYKRVFPPQFKHPTLAMIGYVQAFGPLIPLGELQARWAVRVLSGLQSLPPEEEMWQEIEEHRQWMTSRFYKPKYQVDIVNYMDVMAGEIGCMPPIIEMLCTCDFRLAFACVFGRLLPYQYRLAGPNAWSCARDAILTSFDRVLRPLQSNVGSLASSEESKKDR